MCGICGFTGAPDPESLQAMTAALMHRGPDEGDTWSSPDQRVHLGHRRLSILDIESGQQPMSSADGQLTIVYNGEIYNAAELRLELEGKGHRFRTRHSDTEMLLYGYREWGSALLERLNGMWAFVLHDQQNHRLFASRDRFGEKPLYYTTQSGMFCFASELSALRKHPATPDAIARRSLRKLFAYAYIPSPHTILEGVHKLPAGHYLTYDLGSQALAVTRYWQLKLEPFSRIPKHPEREWGEPLIELLRSAVRRRLVADVPVGLFLSGGLDSAALTALAIDSGDPIHTFNIGFEEPSFDESRYAQQVAKHCGAHHHSEVLSMADLPGLIPKALSSLDEPMGDGSLLPTYLLAAFAQRHVKVALSGDGSDELLGGYDPFKALGPASVYHRLIPRPIHTAIQWLAARMPVSHRNMSFDFRIKRFLAGMNYGPKLWCPVWMSPLEPDELQELLAEPMAAEEIYEDAIRVWEETPGQGLTDRVTLFYTNLYLQDDILTKVDRATMAVGLEARAPMLDIDLVNFIRQLPARFRLRGHQTKYLLKRALEPYLPQDIIHRGKHGFGMPIGAWIQQGLVDIGREGSGMLNSAFIQKRLGDHRANRRDDRLFLWNTLVFNHWNEKRQR